MLKITPRRVGFYPTLGEMSLTIPEKMGWCFFQLQQSSVFACIVVSSGAESGVWGRGDTKTGSEGVAFQESTVY